MSSYDYTALNNEFGAPEKDTPYMTNYRTEKNYDDKNVAKTLKPKIPPKKAEKAVKAVEKSKHKK